MHGYGSVSLRLYSADHGISFRFYIKLICNGVGRKQSHGISGKKFKLRIAGHGTKNRHTQLSFYRIFAQAADERKIFLISGKTAVCPEVGKALIHNADQVDGADSSCFGLVRRLITR